MKKILRNNRLLALAFFTLFSAVAVGATKSDSMNAGNPVQLKFIGSFNNQTIFQLRVAADPLQNDYSITIRDIYGNSIYRENIKSGNFSKKFLFDTDELGDETLLLEVYNKKAKQVVVYEINGRYKPVQEIAISEIR